MGLIPLCVLMSPLPTAQPMPVAQRRSQGHRGVSSYYHNQSPSLIESPSQFLSSIYGMEQLSKKISLVLRKTDMNIEQLEAVYSRTLCRIPNAGGTPRTTRLDLHTWAYSWNQPKTVELLHCSKGSDLFNPCYICVSPKAFCISGASQRRRRRRQP